MHFLAFERLRTTRLLASFLRNVRYALFTPLSCYNYAGDADAVKMELHQRTHDAATPHQKIRCGNRRTKFSTLEVRPNKPPHVCRDIQPKLPLWAVLSVVQEAHYQGRRDPRISVPERITLQPCSNYSQHRENLGARLMGRTTTRRSKKGSEKVLGRVLGKGSQKRFS